GCHDVNFGHTPYLVDISIGPAQTHRIGFTAAGTNDSLGYFRCDAWQRLEHFCRGRIDIDSSGRKRGEQVCEPNHKHWRGISPILGKRVLLEIGRITAPE